ncbi:MAG: hypothetical protein WC120_05275 [Parcubacteria group bacterium]|jgi:DNA-directed RNA polymerase subunit RPC12/RpoP
MTLYECPDCGAYYLPSAAIMLREAHGGNCAICGHAIAPAHRSPDPTDPWEMPMSRRAAMEAVAAEA